MSIPWIEKYRPKCVNDITYQNEIVSVLKSVINNTNGDFPNFLFYGPSGTGKTSTILAAARELYGPKLMKTLVLELNSSDERGINVIREKVKVFSQFTVSGDIRCDGKPCPSFKLVILDEVDSMTWAAQAALRRIMEIESKTTRFCLICNYISRIIEPIASRCCKFRFKPLPDDIIMQRLEFIAKLENLSCDKETLSVLISCSEGDLRKAITYLQCIARIKSDKNPITSSNILDVAGVLDDNIINNLIDTCSKGSFDFISKCAQDLILDGFNCSQVVLQLHNILIRRTDISDAKKAVIFEKMAEVDFNLIEGADDYLQLLDLLAVLMCQMTKTF